MAGIVRDRLKVTRLSGTLGARIEGADLADRSSSDQLAELRALLIEHLVLIFPDQGHLTPDDQALFAGQWGELQRSPAHRTLGRDDMMALITGGKDEKPVDPDMPERQKLARADVWHTDQTFEPAPPFGTVLLARELPPAGGDTMFANQYVAYEALSAPIREMLRGLRAQHTGEGLWQALGLDAADAPRNSHPVVRRHPETGRASLFVNRIWTRRIEGLSDSESHTLLEFLYAHSIQPEFTFRHRWTQGDLLMWDNRCTQHYAIRDYGNIRREMHRATILGDAPQAY